MDVQKTPYRASELATLVNYVDAGNGANYPMCFKAPPGEYKAGDLYPNNAIDTIVIPQGVTCHLFDDPESTEKSLDLTGGTYNLADFQFQDKLSKIKVCPEVWEFAGVYLKSDLAEIGEPVDSIATSLSASNDSSVEQNVSDPITITSEVSATTQWDVRAGASLMMGARVQGGVSPFAEVEVSTELTLSVEGGYGESRSQAASKGFEVIPDGTIPPKSTLIIDVLVTKQKQHIPIVRQWRNTVTGEVFEETGTVIFTDAFNARVRFREVAAAPVAVATL